MKSTRWRISSLLAATAALVVAYPISAESNGISASVELDEVETREPPKTPAKTRSAVPTSRGAVVQASSYTIKVEVPDRVASGAEAKVTLTITVKSGWKLNQEFPTKLTVTAPNGVTLDKAKLRRKDAKQFSEKKGVFDVVFTSSSSGDKSFAGKFRFAVCTDSTCDPKTEKLTWVVSVT